MIGISSLGSSGKYMDTTNLKLSIVIPVYNEERTLRKLISAVETVDLPFKKEIILIDDGSRDRSREILAEYKDRHKVIFLDKNSGKGSAIRKGFSQATGNMVIIQDADLEYSPQDYMVLLKPILGGDADVVYGSRFLKSNTSSNNIIIYRRGYLFSRALNWMSN